MIHLFKLVHFFKHLNYIVGDSRCVAKGGRCQDELSVCFVGYYANNLCAGPRSRKCCIFGCVSALINKQHVKKWSNYISLVDGLVYHSNVIIPILVKHIKYRYKCKCKHIIVNNYKA